MFNRFLTAHELKFHGWTEHPISNFLGKHDSERASKINPTSTVKLYAINRISKVKESFQFTDWMRCKNLSGDNKKKMMNALRRSRENTK